MALGCAAGKKIASRKAVTKKLYDDVFRVLTDSQRQTVENRLQGRRNLNDARRSLDGKRPAGREIGKGNPPR